MFGKYKVAHLLGIAREHEEQFRHVEQEMTKMGYICFAPAFYDLEIYKKNYELLDDMCYQKLLVCDLCVVVTPDHIGKSTKKRITQAIELNKPVYVWNNDQLIPFIETTQGFFAILDDVPVNYTKINEFTENSNSELVELINSNNLTLRSVIKLMDKHEIFFDLGRMSNGIISDIFLTSKKIILCISIASEDRIKYVFCDTVDEGVDIAYKTYCMSNKDQITIYGYFYI